MGALLHLLRLLEQLRHVGLTSGEHAPSVGRRSDRTPLAVDGTGAQLGPQQ